ncbi:MAG TPA: MFS transporter [Pseudacidobacterium sp.]|jgi:SHS family lactate transporter-like MFS transporter|nr:MFS transporter [Pseudacidobacterium sp.]
MQIRLFSNFRSLTSSQRHAFTASFLGWSLDAFDYFLLVFCVSAIADDFHARVSLVAEALFLTLAFRPVGAFLFGALADKFGRRPILMLNIASYSILELACAFAPSLHVFLILRALFGIAMGGEWGVAVALTFETLPAEGRGFFSGLLQQGYVVGYLVAAVAYALLFKPFTHIPWHGQTLGWRGFFVLGALPALLIFYIWAKVEESPVWREGHRRKSKRSVSITDLRQYAFTFVFLVLLMTGFNAFSHGTQDLYPTFLQKDHGYSAAQTGAIAIVYNIGAMLGGILFGGVSERFGRKRTIIGAALLSLPVIPLFAFGSSLYTLVAGAFMMQFMVQGAWGVVPAYLTELSPGPVRATFPGLAYQLGNLLASRNIVLQTKAAEHYGSYGGVLAVTVFIVAIYLACVTAFGREAKGVEMTI